MILRLLDRILGRTDGGQTIQRLYGAIVASSRNPAYYTDYGVPDTIAGRFEMVVLHVFLVLHRMKGEGEPGRALGQQVFDAFCRDMDANLREMGVGDLTVPKKMKRIGSDFYGRVGVYDPPLETDDMETLAQALARNVLGVAAPDDDGRRFSQARALAIQVRRIATAFAATPFETFARGELPVPPVEPFAAPVADQSLPETRLP